MTWAAEFKMKDLLTTQDVEPAEARRRGQATASRLNRSSAFPPGTRDDLGAQFRAVENQEEFNEAMNALYDAGDALRVWIA